MIGFVPQIEKFHLEVGQPVFLPGQRPAIFVEYLDSAKDRSLVIPVGQEEAHAVFTLTLRPNRFLENKVLHYVDLVSSQHKSPPGSERMVGELKNHPGVDNPFAVAWATRNKQRREKNQFKGEASGGEAGPGAKSASDKSASALTTASLRQVGLEQTTIKARPESKPNRGRTKSLERPGGVVRR